MFVIPIPIFQRQERKEDIKERGRRNFNKEERKRLRALKSEIAEFKQRFTQKDIRYSPELNMLYRTFGHTDIEQCNLRDLLMLGFNSNLIVQSDLEVKPNSSHH
jgi:hypothetical protein